MKLTWTNDKKKVMLTQNNTIKWLSKEHGMMNQVPTKLLPLNYESYKAPQDHETKPKYAEIVKY